MAVAKNRSAIGRNASKTTGVPSSFITRTISATDDGETMICAGAQTATVPKGLSLSSAPIFDSTNGSITFVAESGVTIEDNTAPHTGLVALVNIGTDTYRVASASSGTGGAATWGDIGGSINDQSDLVIALTEKANASETTASLNAKADLVEGKVPYSQLPVLGSLGTYATTAALETAHPAASSAGATALVGAAAPYVEYVSDGAAWVQVPALNAPVTITAATTLTRALHANRQIVFSGANATLTIPNDATGGLASDDSFEVHTLNGSAGVPTLVTPDGKSIVGSATKIIGATRKGADQWTVGTTDPAAGSGTVIDMTTGNSFAVLPAGRGSTAWSQIGVAGPGSVGTVTARTAQYASLGYLDRIGIVSLGAAGSNSYIGTTSGAEVLVAPDTNALFSPQRIRCIFGVTDALSACRTGAGFMPGTPIATVEPSTIINSVMFAADSTDSQLSLMCNDGSGNATKTVLNGGTGFPANTNGADLYDCYLEFVGGATRALNYCITNKVTGVKASGTVTSKLPVAGTLLRAGIYRSTAANTTAAAIDIVGIFGGGFAQMGATS